MIFKFFRRKKEIKQELRATKEEQMLWIVPGGDSTNITPERAMQATAVFRAVSLIAETLGSLPLHTYSRIPGGGKERAADHPMYALLHDEPNPAQTSIEFLEMMQGHLLLRGNAYAEIVYVKSGQIVALIPLHPDRVTIDTRSGQPLYTYRDVNGKERKLASEQVLHVKGLSSDGITGLSPIECCRRSVALSLSAEQYAQSFFENSAQPSGVLEHPERLGNEAYKRIKEAWNEQHQGARSQGVAVLEEGMSWKQLGMTNDQAQFLESRKFQVNDIARLFNVPPHMLGDLERATFSNIEQQALQFVVYTMRPWLVRWEKALKRSLLSDKEKQTYFFEFLVDGLLRGDIKSRYEAYAIGRQNGWLSADDIRERENMNPLPNGAGMTYLEPLNMTTSGQPKEAPAPTAPQPGSSVPSAARDLAITLDQHQQPIDVVVNVEQPQAKIVKRLVKFSLDEQGNKQAEIIESQE